MIKCRISTNFTTQLLLLDDYVPQRRRSRSGSRDSISVVLGRVGRRSSSIDYGSVRSGSKEGSIDGASVERTRKFSVPIVYKH